MNPQEIYPGIFRVVQHRSRKIAPPVNVYIIAGEEGLIFDAGYGDDTSIRLMGEAINFVQNKNPKWHISNVIPSHSHPDHFSGLKQIQSHYNIKVMLTGEMAKVLTDVRAYHESYRLSTVQQYRYATLSQRISQLPLQLVFRSMYKRVYGISFLQSYDSTVVPGQTISVNGYTFTVLHGPGHCNDHIMLYEKQEGILFAGDNILRSIYTWLGPPRSDLAEYYATLEACCNLPNLKLILTAHGSPINNPKERIKEIIEYRKLRTKQVFSIVANEENGITFNKLLNIIYPRSVERRWLAKGWIIVTIEYLLQKNALRFEGKRIKANKFDIHKL
ncbi:MAG: MBL fold metallo-hydrolase [Spirochaetes bacterium]|nr:MBL fold metallo-hydrolase [Spirochaetota bacterium]